MSAYDERLLAIERFERHPQMVPWVGDLYGEPGWKRILFVGESPYLPKDSKIHLDAATWYGSRKADLTEKEAVWTCVRGTVASGRDQHYPAKAHVLYANLERVLLDVGFPRRSQMLDYVAFGNFFQRPARTGVSIVADDTDREQGVSVLREVMQVLAPSFVCVVSRLTWPIARQALLGPAVVADFFPHPGSQWWNRRSGRYRFDSSDDEALTGREKLKRFLLAHRAFGSPE